MKGTSSKFKLGSLGLVSLVAFFLLIFGVQAFAGNYIGEYRWKLIDPENDANYVIGKFAVTDVGGGHHVLNGTFTNFENNVPINTDVAHGNAEVVDSMLVVTLVNTFDVSSEEYGFSVINFQLNPSTLSGTFKTIDTAYQFSSDEITKEYLEGSLEFIPNYYDL